jgi:hypothetical protein
MKRSGFTSYPVEASPRLTVKRSKWCRRFHGLFHTFGGASFKKPFDQELVYLMGGENREFEVADFPRLGKRMVKSGEKFEVYDVSNAKPFGPLDI